MKKSLQLFFVLGVLSSANAQQKNNNGAKIVLQSKHSMVNQSAPYSPYKGIHGEYNIPFSKVFQKNETVSSSNKTEWSWYSEEEIGQTRYDIQTNATIYNHIVNNADGTISAIWTTAHSANPYDDRGTGYNYFNGTAWGAVTDARIEGDRVGYTTILNTQSGKEYVLAHNTNKSQLHESFRESKGTGTWVSDTTLKSPHEWGNFWPKSALGGANGETIHAISITYPTAGQNSTDPAYYNGQTGAILYSRGEFSSGSPLQIVWSIYNDTLPLLGPTHYSGFSADDYTIDAKGETIVIVAGGFGQDVVMIKSLDNGTSWTKTVVQQFPIPKYDYLTMTSDTNSDGAPDTLWTNDGALAALIDNTGLVHVFYGRQRMLGPALGELLSYPFTDGLYYWNENSTAEAIIAAVKDMDNTGAIEYYEYDQGNTWPFGLYSGQSLTTFPSAGVDANNNIYLTYSSIAELTYNSNNKSYRHQYVMRSDDQGATWWPSLDITENYTAGQSTYPVVEGVYGSIARRVDTHAHIVYQRDDGPGTGVPTGSTGSPDEGDNTSVNSIVYVKVPIANLINDVGVSENKNAISAVGVYPNPASDVANLVIKSAADQTATITISNMLGQQLATFSKSVIAGTNRVTVDVQNYNTGVYFIKTTIGSSSVTSKVIID